MNETLVIFYVILIFTILMDFFEIQELKNVKLKLNNRLVDHKSILTS